MENHSRKATTNNIRSYLRVFLYNDKTGWALNFIAFAAMVLAGTSLPLMHSAWGSLINVFDRSATGQLSSGAYIDEVVHYTLLLVYIFIGRFALIFTWTMLINIAAIRTIKNFRVDFVRQLLRQEIGHFDENFLSIGGQITENSDLIYRGISEKLGIILQSLSMLISAFVVAFAVQWKLALITMVIIPMNTIIMLICVYFDNKLEGQIFDIYNESDSFAEETLSAVRTAHAFWAFPKLMARFDKVLGDARQIGTKKSILYAILFPAEFFSIAIGHALAFWQGARMYLSGDIRDPGTILTVFFAVLTAAQAMTQITPQLVAVSKAMAAAQNLFSTIDRVSSIDSLSKRGITLDEFQGNIRLQGVCFSYPSRSETPVLEKLNLEFPSNTVTAIVGASGSGKSTIFGLLERWYAYSSGTITLDGHKLESMNLRWLRTNIRLIQQEPTLFSGTIYQNVLDGLASSDSQCSDEEKTDLVVTACKTALIHDFIAQLPKGYDTWIGEKGASLSGGQKQRLVIARTIISNPKVLLLDEATSALDPSAEKTVQAALNNIARDRTVVIIAHRLSTVRDSDNIIVLGKKGQVMESGTHDQLVDLGGAYASLVRAQDLGENILGSLQEKDVSDEKSERAIAVIDSQPAEALAAISGKVKETGSNIRKPPNHYGLFHGLFLIMREQRSLWWPLCLSFISCVAAGLISSSTAVVMAKSMEIYGSGEFEKANFFALMFLVIALCGLLAYATIGWTSNVIAQTIMQFYRRDILDNTLRQDMTAFDKPSNSTGALVSRLVSEPSSLQDLLSINLSLILICIVNVLCSCIIAIAFGWKLGLAMSFGALPVLIGAGYIRIRLETKFEQDTAERFATSSAIATEAAMSIRTICSLALEETVIKRYSQSLQGIVSNSISNLGVKMFFYSLSQSVPLLMMAFGFLYGGKLMSTGEYTLGQFYMVYLSVLFSGQGAATLFQHTTSISKAGPAINYIFGLRQTRVLVDDDDDDAEERKEPEECDNHDHDRGAAVSYQLSDLLTDMESLDHEKSPGLEAGLDHVHFSYPLRPKQKVLRGINMSIQPGKMIALVGASGCGKSTLISLLERFYDPSSGMVWIKDRHDNDRHDIKTIHRRRYRRDTALVQQEPILYQGSILDNIALGVKHNDGTQSREPSEAEIVAACQSANIWDFIASLPDGLHTSCGSQGFGLSGGQRQRIAIARALIRKPRLLLLDEATSALDTASEKAVQHALDQAAEGRTTVAVAHRLSTIRDAHVIFVFLGGIIVESGSHDELLRKKGVYYEMVLAQSLDRET